MTREEIQNEKGKAKRDYLKMVSLLLSSIIIALSFIKGSFIIVVSLVNMQSDINFLKDDNKDNKSKISELQAAQNNIVTKQNSQADELKSHDDMIWFLMEHSKIGKDQYFKRTQ